VWKTKVCSVSDIGSPVNDFVNNSATPVDNLHSYPQLSTGVGWVGLIHRENHSLSTGLSTGLSTEFEMEGQVPYPGCLRSDRNRLDQCLLDVLYLLVEIAHLVVDLVGDLPDGVYHSRVITT